MAVDLEQLLVTLEASTKSFERALARAEGVSVTKFRAIETQATTSMQKIEAAMTRAGTNIGNQFRNLGATMLAGLAIESIVSGIGQAIKAMDDLGDSAAALGISAQELQTWQRMAQNVGEDSTTMTRILNRMADQAMDTKSELTQLFAEFGKVPTGNVTQDMQTFMSILEQMHAPGQRLAAIMQVLGERLGPRMAEMLAQGGGAFKQTFAEMEADGSHFTDAQIEEAGRIRAEWDKITAAMTLSFQKFVITTIQGWGLIFDKLNEYWTKLRAVQADDRRGLLEILNAPGPAVPGSNLGPRINRNPFEPGPVQVGGGDALMGLQGRGASPAGATMLNPQFRANLYNAIRSAEAATGGRAQVTSTYRTYAEQARLYARYKAGLGGLAAPPGTSRHERGMAADIGAGPVLDWLHAHAGEFNLEFLTGRAGAIDPGHIQAKGAGGTEAVIEKQTAAVKRNTIAAKENVETKKAADVWDKERTAIYDQSESSINMLTRAYEDQQTTLESNAQAMAEVGDMLSGAASGFVQDLLNGTDAGEAFSNMLKRLAAQLADMAIKGLFSGLFGGGGGGGGILGGIFGGGGGMAGGMASGMSTSRMVPMGGKVGGSSMGAITVGGSTINVSGNADSRTVMAMAKMIERNNQMQHATLQRDWGKMNARYRSLRG